MKINPRELDTLRLADVENHCIHITGYNVEHVTAEDGREWDQLIVHAIDTDGRPIDIQSGNVGVNRKVQTFFARYPDDVFEEVTVGQNERGYLDLLSTPDDAPKPPAPKPHKAAKKATPANDNDIPF